MTATKPKVNAYNPGMAPLRNMGLLDTMIQQAIDRQEHLPGMITFYGPSGFGKSTAAAYVAAMHDACYVEFRSMWTKKAFLETLLRELAIQAPKTGYQMLDAASQELAACRRVLILDEFDNAVQKDGMVELVRDLYEQSRSPIILIGEERLPQKLQKWERFYSRILNWGQAEKANHEDGRRLNQHYYSDVTVEDDLLQHLVDSARGSVRTIVTNLDRIARFARNEGVDSVGKTAWAGRELFTSVAPKARSFS